MLLFDGQLDTPTVNLFEQKFEKSRFARVDADIVDRLIVKDDAKKVDLTEDETKALQETFKNSMPAMDKVEFNVEVQALGASSAPVLFTQNEFMRRMKDISRFQSGMGFYGQMPDTYSVILNADHPLIKKVLADKEANANIVSQLIDLALLQNGMLKGEALDKFLKRSVELM